MQVDKELSRIKAERPASQLPASDVNPFIYRGPLWTWREVLVVLGFGTWLLPLRLLLCLLLMGPIYLLLLLSISFGFDPQQPMSGWRRQVQIPVAYILRAALFIMGVYWVETTGELCSPSEAKTVCCAPHSTFLDTPFLFYWLRLPSSISKLENLSYPLFGVLFRAMQVLTVDRSSKTNRHLAFEQMKQRGADEREQRHLLVFPEGTCTNREALITFKMGAFAAGKPVQPVALEWPRTLGFDMTWTNTGRHSRLVLALHLLCQPVVRCRVHFLPVYRPNLEEQQDAELFARNVRQVIADKLGLPTTGHSIEDMFLAKEARKLGVDLGFEMRELQTLFEINLKDAKQLLKRYGRLFKNKRKLSAGELAKLLGLDANTESFKELFTLLCENENEQEIDFGQFLIGVCQLSQALNQCDLEASIDLVWQACGGNEGVTELSVDGLRGKLVDIFPGRLTSNQVKKMFTTKGNQVDYVAFSKAMREQSMVLFAAMRNLDKQQRLHVLREDEQEV
ncbi:hypothetical protein BASA81_003920 [Batrachochytrium salamandrivorans]|nr:hypothetical protein BASA81_003920 [Batrachochytrium salamandrivorans]